MSCTSDNSILLPVDALAGPTFSGVCVAQNITSNSDVVSLMQTCCGSSSVTLFDDGCFSYCNVTGSGPQATWKKCFEANPTASAIDHDCLNGGSGGDPFTASAVTLTPSAGSTYLGGSSGTLVFPITTGAASSSGAAATTTGAPQPTSASSNSTGAASGGSKTTASSSKAPSTGSSSSSAANASSTNKSGGPSVHQLSKGAAAILALAFMGQFMA